MRNFTIAGRIIEDEPYVIAEIGCNHNGSFDRALEMVDLASDSGVDAVKFQKRTPKKLFMPELLATPYESQHSYGKTYGEHRAFLDWFGWYEFNRLKMQAKRNDVDFIVTPFTISDADFVDDLGVDAVKIASCDIRNTPMLYRVRQFRKPIILSTGGGSITDIARAVETIGNDRDTAILHCISQYPVNDKDLNINNICTLSTHFSSNAIGFSSHHSGLLPCFLAYVLGARIFEVHFTLNRGDKGTDHGFSMEPEGLRRLCSDLKRIPTMLGEHKRPMIPDTTGFVTKFGKSWYAMADIPYAAVISADMLHLMAPCAGAQPYELHLLLGKAALRDIKAGEPVKLDDVG